MVGFTGNFLGLSETAYILSHALYEILSNTEAGKKAVNNILIWPQKDDFDSLDTMLGDPFWGWVGWRLADSAF